MKKLINLSIVLVMVLGLLPARTAIAEVTPLWEQLPNGGGAIGSMIGETIHADNFNLTEASSIAQIEIWSNYAGPYDLTFDIYANTIDTDDYNIPGVLVRTEVINSNGEEDDICPQNGDGYYYCKYRHTLSFDPPLDLADGHYWLSVYGSAGSDFGWSPADIPSQWETYAFKHLDNPWNGEYSSRAFAFRLLEPQQTCPASVVVVNTNDSGAGSLRQAIIDVCPGGTITFAESLSAGTITLTSELILDKDVTIDGSALAEKVSISGNNLVRVFSVVYGNTVSLESLIITGGKLSDPNSNGGGINNGGTLSINNSNLVDNTAAVGGGIHNYGTLSITNSILSQNTATNGGALTNTLVATLTGCTISENQAGAGGGIDGSYGTLTVTDSTISGNIASSRGGGIIVSSGSQADVFGSTFVNNTAGEFGGSGIMNYGTTSVVNSTFTGNITSADVRGSAINNSVGGNLTLYNSTLSGNTGYVTLNNENASMSLANTIIANTTSGWDCSTYYGTLTESINNWVSDGASGGETCSATNFGDPMLAPLADNGGPTQTMALQAGSPAIDAGDNSICAGALVSSVDQRGAPRPYGSACDIGAYEYGAEPPTPNLSPVVNELYVRPESSLPGMQVWVYFEFVDPDSDTFTCEVDWGVGDGRDEFDCNPDYDDYDDNYSVRSPKYTYSNAGSYNIQVWVTDGEGNHGTNSIQYDVVYVLAGLGDETWLASNTLPTTLELYGFTVEGRTPLSFYIESIPEHGSLDTPEFMDCKQDEDEEGIFRCRASVVYTPNNGDPYTGWDKFSFSVEDNGNNVSSPGWVDLYVADNTKPIANDGSATVSITQTSTIMLEATDSDLYDYLTDRLSFFIAEEPVNGTLEPPELSYCSYDIMGITCEAEVLYTPFVDTEATTDSFTFYVNDTHQNSDPATVYLTLRAPTTLTVNSTNDVVDTEGCDETHCSLREAVNAAISGGTITFDTSLSGATITLISQLTLDKNVTIDGSMLDLKVTISGGGLVRVFGVETGVVVTLDSLIIANGYHSSYGGGINNAGTLTVTNSTLAFNEAGFGGGINNDDYGTLFVTYSNLDSNTATHNGGGIFNMCNADYGSVLVSNSTLSGNTASFGGGIASEHPGDTETNVISSTIIGNQATETSGGGLLNGLHGTMTVVNSTLSNNTALQYGGGISNYGTLTLYNSTLSGNTRHSGGFEGHGLANLESGILNYANTIIADSPTGTACYNEATILTNFNNLVEEGEWTGGCSASLNVDPLLAPLGDNGGPTETMALQAGSPAIDTGDNTICAGALVGGVDQRGVMRPQGTSCDIGAYEVEQVSVTGALKISKAFDPLTSGFTGTFAIDYDCDDGTDHDGTVNLAAGASETITGIPTGTQCTVTEQTLPAAPTGWTFGSPTFNPVDGVVTISEVSPAYTEVIVTNTISRDLGELKISKDFDPIDSGFTGTFAIHYDCDDGTAHDGTVHLAAGGSQTITGIPTGTQCTVTEQTLPAAPTGWSFETSTFNPVGGEVTVSEVSPAYAEVIVTNTISRDTGGLRIYKNFDPGTSGFSDTFAIAYNCDDGTNGTVHLAAGTSQTITGIPTGTGCTITEPNLPDAPEGWTFGTPSFSPSNFAVIQHISPAFVQLTVTNTISQDAPDVGELKISKVFDPLTSGFTGSFTIEYDCDDGTAHDGTVNLVAGASETISGIPTGTTCTVAETTLPSAPEEWAFGTPTFSPENGTVIISGTIVEVTVTNTINPVAPQENQPPILDPIGDKSVYLFTLLTFTVNATDDGLPGDTLTYSLADGVSGSVPSGASIVPATGLFTWTPTILGAFTFDVCVSDGELQDCETITVTVTEGSVVPALPSSFYGHVSISGVVAGDYILAHIDNQADVVASDMIEDDGTGELVYALNVPAYPDGSYPDTVIFKIDGKVVATAPWASGTNVRLDIEEVATHQIDLVVGWNLVSFNVIPTSTATADVLSTIADKYDLVYAWDATGASSGAGNWLIYDPKMPAGMVTLTDLNHRMGFWIRMTEAATLTVSGLYPTETEILFDITAGGWNLVGYPASVNRDLPTALDAHGVEDFTLVYAYHAADTTEPWKLFDIDAPDWVNTLLAMSPGKGYWVFVTANATLTVPFQ